jgi:branched-chain amino acid transport system substrate-binding protein
MKTARSVLVVPCLPLIFALFILSSFSTNEAVAQTKTLKIGLITSVTGPMAPSFKPLVDAAKPAADYLNQRGGITVKGKKYRIEVVTADDQSSPPGAVSATNKLIQDDIKFIVAPLFIPSNRAIAPICEEAKIVRMTPSCADTAPFSPPNRYSFNAESTNYNPPYVYDKLRSIYPQVKRIAIIRPDDPGAKTYADVTEKEIKKRGVEIVFNEAYKIPTEDFYPILTKTMAQKPDAIEMIFGIIPWAKGIIEQSREMGFTGPITAVAAVGDTNLLKSVIDPKYAYDICQANLDVFSPKMLPVVQDLRKLMEKATKEKFDFGHVLTLQAVWIIMQGIEKAQSLDTDKVASALENMKDVETPYGAGKFIGKDLIGIDRLLFKSIPFSRIVKGGKIEFEFLPIK